MGNLLLSGVLALAALLTSVTVQADEVTTYAIVKDNGLLRLRGQLYRLDGLYIPRINDLCDSSLMRISCETQNAVQALNTKIRGFVTCVDHSVNRDGTLNAYCSYGGDDLGAFLIRNGYAMAAGNAPYDYFAMENLARHQGRGLWMTLRSPGVQTLY